jgi:hypothetical protein
MDAFRIAFVGAVACVALLALLGLYPVALILAAVLVPLLLIVYLFDVDIYEGSPWKVVALIMVLSGVLGLLLGLIVRGVDTPTSAVDDAAALRVVIVPSVGVLLALFGPLLLLRDNKYNDVLDGVTFGAVSAVTLVGAVTLAQAVELLRGGMRPPGANAPWLWRLVDISVLTPVLAACTVGWVGAALWLRYRAPVHDRHALGLAGRWPVALTLAIVAQDLAAGARYYVRREVAVLVIAILAAIAIAALRRAIQLGLRQEAAEIEIGGTLTCANCHRETARHTFCGRCGVALTALPRAHTARAIAGSTETP